MGKEARRVHTECDATIKHLFKTDRDGFVNLQRNNNCHTTRKQSGVPELLFQPNKTKATHRSCEFMDSGISLKLLLCLLVPDTLQIPILKLLKVV